MITDRALSQAAYLGMAVGNLEA